MEKDLKDLLLRDLCARLPYGVKVRVLVRKDDPTSEETLVLNGFNGSDRYKLWVHDEKTLSKYGCCGRGFYVSEVRPYLRPMSSMTEEECLVLGRIKPVIVPDAWKYIKTPVPLHIANIEQFNFFNEHYLDWGCLIEKGSALEAPEGMYKTE